VVFWAIFDLIFLGGLYEVVRFTIIRLRFGEPRVEFRTFPFRPGATLAVKFDGGQRLGATRLDVELRCIEEKFTRDLEGQLHITCTGQMARLTARLF
jgi:hypothetical protein